MPGRHLLEARVDPPHDLGELFEPIFDVGVGVEFSGPFPILLVDEVEASAGEASDLGLDESFIDDDLDAEGLGEDLGGLNGSGEGA